MSRASLTSLDPYHLGVPRTARENLPALAAAIPDPAIRALFTERFVHACDLYDALVDAACLRILVDADLLVGDRVSPEDPLPPRCLPAFHFLVEKLAGAGILERDGGALLPNGVSTESVEALAEELETKEPGAAVGAEVVRALVAEAPAFFRGEKTGEDILF